MSEKSAVERTSLLKASLVAMTSVAILISTIVSGIWVYTGLIIQREKSLVGQLLPELEVAHRLTAATAGLQSQGVLMQASRSVQELERRRSQLDNTITATRQTIDTLEVTEKDVRSGLEQAVESMASLVLSLADIKQRHLLLQQQTKDEKLRLLDDINMMAKNVKQQEVRLTEQLLDRSESVTKTALLYSTGERSRESFSVQLNEYDQINLDIQDYLLVVQDLASLRAVVESLPLLRTGKDVDIALQNKRLLISALVSRSIYVNDETGAQMLLLPLRKLRDDLRKPGNLFELQKSALTLEADQDDVGRLMLDHQSETLMQTDALKDNTSTMVADLAAQTLTGLERYRIVLGLLCIAILTLLAGICYSLLYRKTVLPLMEITQQFYDVGSTRFPEKPQQYYLQELSTLSAAMQQLDSAQKNMQLKDAQMQLVNKDLTRVNQELEQFAHIASHDLQEPLRKLQQFSALLEEDYESLLDDEGRFFLETIRKSAQRMSALIKETLAYSRAGSTNQKVEQVDLSALLELLMDEMDIAVREAQADVTIGELPVVQANELGMAQLFRNLLLNALKYRKPGTPAIIRIECAWFKCGTRSNIDENAPEHTKGGLRIRISDNGIGIPEKYQQRIFSPFERLNSGTVQGTGLGLAMCRKVCDSHGWDLSVSSEPGVGTVFEVHVPDDATVSSFESPIRV